MKIVSTNKNQFTNDDAEWRCNLNDFIIENYYMDREGYIKPVAIISDKKKINLIEQFMESQFNAFVEYIINEYDAHDYIECLSLSITGQTIAATDKLIQLVWNYLDDLIHDTYADAFKYNYA